MNNKDLRAEQIKLLRFEKTIEDTCKAKVSSKALNKAPVLAGVAAVTAAATSAAAKLGSDAPLQYAANIEAAAASSATGDAWLVNLAEAVTTGHNAIENLAQQGAFIIMQAGGGTIKPSPTETVKSLLTSGLF